MDSKINPKLDKLVVPIEKLKFDEKNARSHSERNVKLIADSLERFGQQKPIVVDQKFNIIAGNGTVLAASGLGWKNIAAVVIDIEDEALRKAYGIMDNRTAELADWDAGNLQEQIAALELQGIHAQQVGFEDAELASLLARLNAQPPESFQEYSDGAMHTDTECPKCGFQFNTKAKE